ncbi:unnamed protein product [Brassicogethes aeneus]|uniref:Uncharacterized protein n=1 Tax=Brassicogethes aeneus TaxID=1431903 RepID=A0A9P0BIQ5_BRAAE|nr:unnamed protein product [Brassicogethes aeneus]
MDPNMYSTRGKGTNVALWKRKCTSIAHATVSAAWPRSFLVPLQVGLGAFLNKTYGFRQLIDVLSSLGFSASFHETALFELSVVMRPEIAFEDNAYSQFVFENADVNTRTINGFGTFHAMGGIQCVTPKTAIRPDQAIKRYREKPSAAVVGTNGRYFGGEWFHGGALSTASKKCQSLNQKTCFVTLDQPLYIKARDIISYCDEAEFSNVIIRLGGFHLLMSFMGSIGYLMSGSGLNDVLAVLYAEKSIEHMLTGHAYGRGVRGHMLLHLALAKLVFDLIDISDDERLVMNDILCNSDRTEIMAVCELCQTLMGKFQEQLQKLESLGLTAKLWVQYFKMTTYDSGLRSQHYSPNWIGCWMSSHIFWHNYEIPLCKMPNLIQICEKPVRNSSEISEIVRFLVQEMRSVCSSPYRIPAFKIVCHKMVEKYPSIKNMDDDLRTIGFKDYTEERLMLSALLPPPPAVPTDFNRNFTFILDLDEPSFGLPEAEVTKVTEQVDSLKNKIINNCGKAERVQKSCIILFAEVYR